MIPFIQDAHNKYIYKEIKYTGGCLVHKEKGGAGEREQGMTANGYRILCDDESVLNLN